MTLRRPRSGRAALGVPRPGGGEGRTTCGLPAPLRGGRRERARASIGGPRPPAHRCPTAERLPGFSSLPDGTGQRALLLAQPVRGGVEVVEALVSDELGLLSLSRVEMGRSAWRKLGPESGDGAAAPAPGRRGARVAGRGGALQPRHPARRFLPDADVALRHLGIEAAAEELPPLPSPEEGDATLAVESGALHREPEFAAWLPPEAGAEAARTSRGRGAHEPAGAEPGAAGRGAPGADPQPGRGVLRCCPPTTLCAPAVDGGARARATRRSGCRARRARDGAPDVSRGFGPLPSLRRTSLRQGAGADVASSRRACPGAATSGDARGRSGSSTRPRRPSRRAAEPGWPHPPVTSRPSGRVPSRPGREAAGPGSRSPRPARGGSRGTAARAA